MPTDGKRSSSELFLLNNFKWFILFYNKGCTLLNRTTWCYRYRLWSCREAPLGASPLEDQVRFGDSPTMVLSPQQSPISTEELSGNVIGQ